MRRVRTASGAVAVQIVAKAHGDVVEVEHVGSAHTDAELALLLTAARERLAPDQQALDLGELTVAPARLSDVADWTDPQRGQAGGADAAETAAEPSDPAGPAPGSGRRRGVAAGGRVVATSALTLWNVLLDAYTRLGFDVVADEAFRALVLARVIEPTSKADTTRVLNEIGAPAPALRTLFRALGRCAERDYRGLLAAACFGHATRGADVGAGPLGLVLYDVTTLHFEAENEDKLRRVGMSKERRVDPQIQVGLLVDASGFPLEVHCFSGNTAETSTLLPVLQAFQDRHKVSELVVVADAGMLSARNLNAISDAGLSFIVATAVGLHAAQLWQSQSGAVVAWPRHVSLVDDGAGPVAGERGTALAKQPSHAVNRRRWPVWSFQ